jgi:serine/threonine protein kinase/Flp pilus assembly protein TadD
MRADCALPFAEAPASITMPEQPAEKSIFLAAIEIDANADRAAFVEQACAGNAQLRAEVDDLLRAHAMPQLILDAVPTSGQTPTHQPIAERPGTVIGPYKLLEQIGEGGMGTVWMAQQQEPVKRLVALKLIKAGMDSRQVITRFEAERQALALMDHPNIARVLDGGTTGAGRPYFVMDLVKGVPITRYCDDHYLTPRQRLELFIPVCQAIQHAHQKGIIHRDIKPSNILVAQYDGRPVPKVIDFGVAKAAGQQLTEQTLVTGFGSVIGTLEYMSPEQAELNQLDIDTRSDIYSLGVVLYELLTGSTPLERKRLKQTPFAEVLRIIREEEPQKPSTRLSDSTDSLPSVSAQRQMEPAKLTRLMRGELDWIVMKALEKDRNRRYETANSFVLDVQRYLVDEPVQARPPSVGYRLRKLARRNRAALAVGTAGALVVLVSAGSIGWMLSERRERQQRGAEEIGRSVAEAGQLQRQRRWPEALALAQHAREVLERTEGQESLRPQMEELLRDLEMVGRLEEIELRKADASVGSGFGFARPAAEYHPAFRDYGIEVLASEVWAVANEVGKRQIADYLIASLDNWARAEPDAATRDHLRAVVRLADPEGVLARWRAALDRRDVGELRKIIASLEVGRVSAATLAILGDTLSIQGLRTEAIELLRAAHANYPSDFWINQNLASAHVRTDPPQWGEALRYYTAALALRPKSHMLYSNIGVALNRLGREDDSLAALQKALELRPDCAPAHSNLGAWFLRKGKYVEAEAALRRAIAYQPDLAMAYRNLASLCGTMKRTDEALAYYDQALALNPALAEAYCERGMVRMIRKEFEQAATDFRLALKHNERYADAHYGLGWASEQEKDYAEAVKWYETAIRHDPRLVEAHYRLGLTYSAWGRREATTGSRQLATEKFDAAIAKFNDAIRLDEKHAEAWYSLGNASRDRGQIRAAVTAFEKAAALKPGSDDPEYRPYFNLGNVYARLGESPKAVEAFRAATTANPDDARAYISLAAVLAEQGDFAAAEKAAASALAQDKKRPDAVLNYAVALDRQGRYADALEFVRRSLKEFKGGAAERARLTGLAGLYEQFARLQQRLPAILGGEETPASADLLQLGEICIATTDYAAAARFYRDAFAAGPDAAERLGDGYRFDAARAAACAGCGRDKRAALTPVEQGRWREQALEWLRGDLRLWARNVERGGPLPAPAVVQALQRWRHHAHLAGLRGPGLDKLQPGERDDWRKLWADVDALSARLPVP